jgi:hypothetical protein
MQKQRGDLGLHRHTALMQSCRCFADAASLIHMHETLGEQSARACLFFHLRRWHIAADVFMRACHTRS